MIDNRGFSLIEMLVSAAILAFLGITVTGLIILNKSAVAVDVRQDSLRRLTVNTAEIFRDTGFSLMASECARLNLFETTQTRFCTDEGGVFRENPPSTDSFLPIRQRVDVFANPDQSGEFCTEVSRCRYLARGRLLQVEFASYSKSAGSAAKISGHMVRMAR